MNKREEYAIGVIVLIALLLALVSMMTSSMDLGMAAAIVAIVAVLYSMYVVHMEVSDARGDNEYYTQHDYESYGRRVRGRTRP